MAAAGLHELPVAALERRVDLVAPAFSNPTNVTNRLFPISRLASVVLNGTVDGKPFRTETTLLPDTRIIEWSPGQSSGRSSRSTSPTSTGAVALDFYAQADDGSVWYFGEDVYNYRHGVVADTSGTWLGQGGARGDDHARRSRGRRRAPAPRTSPGWSGRRSPSRPSASRPTAREVPSRAR